MFVLGWPDVQPPSAWCAVLVAARVAALGVREGRGPGLCLDLPGGGGPASRRVCTPNSHAGQARGHPFTGARRLSILVVIPAF